MKATIYTFSAALLTFVTMFASFASSPAIAKFSLTQSLELSYLLSQAIPARDKPRIEDGNLKEGWEHIDKRHITGNHPNGAGDLFPSGTTRVELTKVAESVVSKGTLIGEPVKRIKSYEDRIKVQGKILRVRVSVDSQDKNRVVTMFPVLSE